MLPTLAVTLGDPAGVGPEVAAAAMRDERVRRACRIVAIGAGRCPGGPFLPVQSPGPFPPGRPTAESGRASFAAVRLGTRLALEGRVAGLVTAPVSKEAWAMAGLPYKGHTPYFKERAATEPAMMFCSGSLRAALATDHVPLGGVPKALSTAAVSRTALLCAKALRALGLKARLAICALNPHAGEAGLLGSEEGGVLAPAVRSLRRRGMRVDGPLATDAAWQRHGAGRYDALVCLYHDQALGPLRLAGPRELVQWTLGLPFVRTSPGHGTAFDLAGKGKADPEPMVQAILLAARLARSTLRAMALAAAIFVPARRASATLSARDIVDKANELLRGQSSHALSTLTVQTPDWTRVLSVEAWNEGRDKALILVHSPPKDRGTATLRVGPEMWTWMPSVERTIKIPPTMMHNGWMGSDFTYEDIVKADSIVKDYTHKIVERRPAGDHEEVVLECLPKEDAPVVWGKILLSVEIARDDSVTPFREEDYSERGELIRTIKLSAVKIMGGRRIPTRLECVPERKEGRRTIVDYERLEFDVKIPGRLFSLRRLERQ